MDYVFSLRRTLAVLLIVVAVVMISVHVLPAAGFVGTVFYPILMWPCVFVIALAAWVLWRSTDAVVQLDAKEPNNL